MYTSTREPNKGKQETQYLFSAIASCPDGRQYGLVIHDKSQEYPIRHSLLPDMPVLLHNARVKPITVRDKNKRTVEGMTSQYVRGYDPSGINVEISVFSGKSGQVISGDKVPHMEKEAIKSITKMASPRDHITVQDIIRAVKGAKAQAKATGCVIGRDQHVLLGQMIVFAKYVGSAPDISWHDVVSSSSMRLMSMPVRSSAIHVITYAILYFSAHFKIGRVL